MKTFASIVSQVSEATGISESRIRSRQRTDEVVRAREAIFWIARETLAMTYNEIGRMHDSDHSTIILAVKRAIKRRETDADFRELTDRLVAS